MTTIFSCLMSPCFRGTLAILLLLAPIGLGGRGTEEATGFAH